MSENPRVFRRPVLTLALLFGCSQEPCENEAPAVTAEVRLSDPGLRARASSMEVVLRVGEARFSKTFDFLQTLDDGTATFAVVLEPPPSLDGFEVALDVAAYASSGGRGELVAEGSSQIEGSLDACNRIAVSLGDVPAAKDASVDPNDGGTTTPDAGGSFLIVQPTDLDRLWVDLGEVLTFSATVTHSLGASLDGVTVVASETWAVPTLSPDGSIDVTIDTGLVAEGDYTVITTISSDDPSTSSAQLTVRFRSFRPIHVGPLGDTCPHQTAAGPSFACDFTGEAALVEAAGAITSYTHVILHDAGGDRAFYTTGAGVLLPGTSWISAAPQVAAPENTVLECRGGRGLLLGGDEIRVERLMIVSQGACDLLINTWLGDEPSEGTVRHEIDRVVLAALRPEVFDSNSIQHAIGLSADTKLTNSHVYGYWEDLGDLSFADRSELVNNTILFFQIAQPITAYGVEDLVFANNVVVSVPPTDAPLFAADDSTHRLTLAGNVVENFGALIVDLDPGDDSNLIEDNAEGPAELDTPRDPRFFSDASADTGPIRAGIGFSLDGVEIEGRTEILPGAFQIRSERIGPRRELILVGPADCDFCDVTTDFENEIQVAAWSVWSGGSVDLEPGLYAGNAVISWETDIFGKDPPPEAVLISAEEDELWARSGMWDHRSVLTMIDENRFSFFVHSLTVVVDPAAMANETAILVESHPEYPPEGPLEISDVIIDSASGAPGGLVHPLFLGQWTRVQDVVVRGAFETCARFAYDFPTDLRPVGVEAALVNFTCRLGDAPDHPVRGGFELANGSGPLFINVAVDTVAPVPIFVAQRRAVGDTASVALDPPQRFGAYQMSWRGFGSAFGGFEFEDGQYELVGVDEIPVGMPFFVSATDDHLEVGSPALDTGIDPSTIEPAFVPGDSIELISRVGRLIDRGAYEQGN